MRVHVAVGGLVLGCVLAVGCGDPSVTLTDGGDAAGLAPAAGTPTRIGPSPAEVVAQFLDAVRTGDEKAAEGLLTRAALKETRDHSLPIRPPGSPDVTYQVGDTDLLDDTHANVECRWTERGPSGAAVTHDVAWMLKKEDGGWRIAGFAMPVEGLPTPLVVDFEDVEEMYRQLKVAEATLTAGRQTR